MINKSIDFSDFQKVHMAAGTILSADDNLKARRPAYVLTIDFGALGIKQSSAQITGRYDKQSLVGQQVIAVMNFPPKRVAGIKSEVLVLACVCETQGTILLQPTFSVENGARIL